MFIYHGSDHLITKPQFGFGKEDNDYGSGFYTTQDYIKAAEWALNNGGSAAYVNKYEIDDTGLLIVDLVEHGTLCWIAEMIAHRGARGKEAMILGEALVDKYKPDLADADIIIGYGTDNVSSDIMDAFLKNEINIDEADRLFRTGYFGKQYLVKSKKAFDKLQFIGADEVQEQDYDDKSAYLERIKEVIRFLRNRANIIHVNGFHPTGMIAKEAATNDYTYSDDYDYYIVKGEGKHENEK